MPWTTPRTFVTAEVETAAIFNTHLRDNLNFLKSGVALSTEVTATSASTVASNQLVLATQAFTADGSTLACVEFTFNSVAKTVGTDTFNVMIYDGAVAGSGTALAAWNTGNGGTAAPGSTVRKILTPTAGAHTYTARIALNAGTGTATVFASATVPMCLSIGQFN